MKHNILFIIFLSLLFCEKSGVSPEGEMFIMINNDILQVCVGHSIRLEASISDSSDFELNWEIKEGPGTLFPNGMFQAPDEINSDTAITRINVSVVSNPKIYKEIEIKILSNPYNTFEIVKKYDGIPSQTIELNTGEYLTFGSKIINNDFQSTLWKHDLKGQETDQRMIADGERKIILNGQNHGIYKDFNNEIWIFGFTDMTNNFPAYLAKIDDRLNVVTDQFFENKKISCMEISNNNHIFLGGDSSGYVWVAKLSESLEIVWSKTFNNHDNSECTSLTLDEESVVLVGNHFGHSQEYFFRKINDDGEELLYLNKGPGQASSIIKKDNTFLVHGRLPWLSLIEIDKGGNDIWRKEFFEDGNWFSRNIIKTLDNNYVMTGWTSSDISNGAFDGYLIKVDQDGNEFWTRNFGGVHFDYIYHVLPVTDGGFLLSGKMNGKLALIKTDTNGMVTCPCQYP